MEKIMLIALAVILSGCSLSGVDKQPGKSAYGPENTEDQYGEASYTHGWSSVENQRRQDTYKKMHDACNGKYKIIEEENRQQTVNFKFECVK